MKLKALVCAIIFLFFSSARAMVRIPDVPDGRRNLWVEKQHDLVKLQQELEAAELAISALPAKGEIEVDPETVKEDIRRVQNVIGGIEERATHEQDDWVMDKDRYKPTRQARASGQDVNWSDVDLTQGPPSSPISNPRPPRDQQSDTAGDVSSPWFTPQRSLLAAGVLGLGYVFQNASEWAKQRVKRILKTHGKKLSDLDPAEQDLMMAASYHRFNPVGSFFFQEAVLDMPDGTGLRDELWPVLNHVYYGKRKVSRKQARELRKLYDEAKELMVVD